MENSLILRSCRGKRFLKNEYPLPELSKPPRSSSSEGSAERTGTEPNKVSCQRQSGARPSQNKATKEKEER